MGPGNKQQNKPIKTISKPEQSTKANQINYGNDSLNFNNVSGLNSQNSWGQKDMNDPFSSNYNSNSSNIQSDSNMGFGNMGGGFNQNQNQNHAFNNNVYGQPNNNNLNSLSLN